MMKDKKRDHTYENATNNQGMSKEDEVVELGVFKSKRDEKLSREIEEVRSEITTRIYIETS